MEISFMSFKDTNGEYVMHFKSNDSEIMINDKADEVIKELFESLFSRYLIGLEAKMKRSDFIFDYVDLLYYKCYKIISKHGGSYIDYASLIKKKQQ